MTKKIKGQKLLEAMKETLPSGRLTLKDIRRLLTRSNITDIQNAIIAGESIDNIKGLLQNEKDTSILSHFLLNKPVLDPSKLISKNTSYTEVLKSKFPVVGKYLTDMTTLYDICIENYDNDHEYYKEVFEFLLEQEKSQKNLAELVVRLVAHAETNPGSDCGLLDAMEKYADKINLDQNVFVSKKLLKNLERTNANDNDVRELSVSSSKCKKSFPLSLFDTFDVLFHQKPSQPNDVMSLREFLRSVKTSGKVDNINLTQPRECPQR